MLKDWDENIYCNHPFKPSRLLTREVKVGDVWLGGSHPITIQSMTSTPTMNTSASVDQCIRIIEAGADMVRLTAQNIKEAENLENIKSQLRSLGFNTPLIADVHFNPRVAETAATVVEKIRINPGNFIPVSREGSDAIGTIRGRLGPLTEICQKHNTALRIGVNHGSLSERILKQYGNTPEGMVESAMEYLRICEEMDFHQLVFSMKSSNAIVMVQAYRLMVHHMIRKGTLYPIHLGVTEAGEGQDGRLKSSVGIGSLLADGIGNTIRVSLTEDPENEVPVARQMADFYSHLKPANPPREKPDYAIHAFQYLKRHTIQTRNIGGPFVPVVIADLSHIKDPHMDDLTYLGFKWDLKLNKWDSNEQVPDYLYFGNNLPSFDLPPSCSAILNYKAWKKVRNRESYVPFCTLKEFTDAGPKSGVLNFVFMQPETFDLDVIQPLGNDRTVILVLKVTSLDGFHTVRHFINEMIRYQINQPVILWSEFRDPDAESWLLKSAAYYGGLLVDGIGDGLWITPTNGLELSFLNRLSFGILQATRTRITKTEYISCPSCGRTLFDIQLAAQDIRKATQHLKGLKIGIMGCIVNGPGEMADADYGYVGSGTGKVNLYKGHNVVRRNIPSDRAIEELIEIIREHGDWTNP